MRTIKTILIILCVTTLWDCSAKKTAKPNIETYHGYVFTKQKFSGRSSWYGPRFHGRKTASGERYNMYQLTAAHRSLPFGTLLQITNVTNDKKIIVKVNDRGPFISGRVLDLSYAAAQKLGFVNAGTAEIKARVLKKAVASAK